MGTISPASSCGGVINDSGGPATSYGDNENLTFTICPDVPGNVIYLTWFVFDLSTAGNNDDNLTIFDGDNTGSTSLGSYTGSDLQNLVVSGTVFNTTGCLTLVFQSNGQGIGNFSAGFQCTTPCSNPIAAAVMNEPVPLLACVGEVITFDGSASQAAAGFNIVEYLWDFDDSTTDNTSGPLVSHAFDAPGEYVVQLYLSDDNGCANLNLVDLQILVSTTPSFAGTVEGAISCVGATLNLLASVEPITWTGIPDANFGEGVFLPDDVGLPFISTLMFTQFNPGQTITNCEDVIDVCVSMEHTYMGDLVLQVICPNGQSTILHQQGGGNTYLGAANDTDNDANPIPGECWNYCWSEAATNGTWVANSNQGTNSTTVAGIPPSAALDPGTYEPVQSLCNLVGCPLNGEWTYQSTDLFGADNGFICSWAINFDPGIVPDVTQFTPDPGTSILDSAGWTGVGIVPDPNEPLNATATISGPGSFDYSFFVTDNFGCSYDTMVTFIVPPLPILEAGPPIVLCSDPEPMTGVITANGPGSSGGAPFTYSWSPVTGLTNPSNPLTNVFVTESTMFYLSTYLQGHPECGVTDSVLVSPDQSISAGGSRLLTLCASDPTIILTDSLDGIPDNNGVWTNSLGNVIPNTLDPAVAIADVLTYTVTSPIGCIATSTLDITILPLEDPTCCGTVDAGLPSFSCNLTILLEAKRGNTGVGNWTGPAGALFEDAFDDTTWVTLPAGSGGIQTFYWVENDGAFCNLIDSVEKTLTDAYVFSPSITNASCHSYCDGVALMAVAGGNAIAGLHYDWTTGLEGQGENTADGLCLGEHSLTVRDDNNCLGTTTVTVGEPILLEIDSMSFEPVTCSGDCDGQVDINDLEAVEYSFDDGTTWTPAGVLANACEGVYPVRIRNSLNCNGTGSIAVTGPQPVVSNFSWSPFPADVSNTRLEFINLTTGATAYFWNFANLASSTEFAPEFTFDNKEPDTYPVCLVSTNTNNCSDTLCIDVVIDDMLLTYIPNSFSPNGDDKNDVWGLGLNIPTVTDYEMNVFDRWGRLIYETKDPFKPWKGSYQNGGEVLQCDVYAYRILYTIKDTDTRKELVGHVTLIK